MTARKLPDPRPVMSIRFDPDTYDRLRTAAEQRCISATVLVNRACDFFLDRLIPVDEVQWTREVPTDAYDEDETQ